MSNNSNNSRNQNSDAPFLFGICLLAGFFIITAAWRTYLDKVPPGDRLVFEMPSMKLPVAQTPVINAPVAAAPAAQEISEIPSPNAYDFYIKAADLFVRTHAVTTEKGVISINSEQWKVPETIAGKVTWLEKNEKPLELLKKGLQYSCYFPDPFLPGRPGLNPAMMSYSMARHGLFALAELLVVESQVLAARGDWNGAAQRLADFQKFSIDVSQEKSTRGISFRMSNQGRLYPEMWKIYPNLDAAQSKAFIQRWKSNSKQHRPFVETLREDKKMYLSQLERQLQQGRRPVQKSTGSGVLKQLSEAWPPSPIRNREARKQHEAYWDELIRLAEAPFDPKAKAPVAPDDREIHPSFMLTFLGSRYEEARWANLMMELQDSFLLLAMALHAYQLENKSHPQDLNQLVPAYLKELPRDSFGQREPLRYAVTGQEYSLYSVGPDGVDDFGRAIEYKPYPPDRPITRASRYMVTRSSRGDIVLGVHVGRPTP